MSCARSALGALSRLPTLNHVGVTLYALYSSIEVALSIESSQCLRALRRLTGEDGEPCAERLGIDKFQSSFAITPKKTRSIPDYDRIDPKPIFIDQVMLHERARERATAVHQNVLTRLLFQPSDLFRDISLDQGCIPRE